MGTLMVDILDDMAIEGDHSFAVTLVSVEPPITIGMPSAVNVSIIDNDGKITHTCKCTVT